MEANVDYFTGLPHLVMVVEPETKVRFRYQSEGSSHGGLPGKQKGIGKKKNFPTVKLEDYYGSERVFIRVSLYTEDYKKHVIEFMEQNGESMPYIDVFLEEDNTAVFSNLKFLNKKKEEIFELLLDQRMEEIGDGRESVRARFKQEYEKEFKERAKEIMNCVRLCFEAFEECNPERLCEPLFSELICNHKTASKGELRIHRMSRISGSWRGGDEVILLCDKVQKDNISIVFYESDDDCDGTEKWKGDAIFNPADVHYQVAIYFRTPPYKTNTEKTVSVSLSRNGEMSEPIQFKYIPDFTGNPTKKRKLQSNEEAIASPILNNEHSENSSSLQSEPTDDSMSSLDLPIDIDVMLRDFGYSENIEMEQLALFTGILDNESEDISISENWNEEVYNQSFGLDVQDLATIETDGGLASQMSALTIKDYSDCKKQYYLKKLKSKEHSQSDLYKIKQQFQEKLYSSLMKEDDYGNTCLHRSVYENKNVIPILRMSRFANVDIVNMKNNLEEAPLHISTEQDNKELVKILLKYGGNANLINAGGNNCYHIASANNYFDAMCYLLTLTAYKPQLNAFNYEGLTPMHVAVKKNAKECYHLLKLHSANTNAKDQKSGRSLLHYAVEFQPQFVKVLLDEGEIDVNVQDFEGNTPLHLACSKEETEIVKQLLEYGADPNMRNFKLNYNIKVENCGDGDQISTVQKTNLEENSGNDGQTPAELTTNIKIREMLLQSSNKTPGSEEVMKKLCNMLDVGRKWEQIAIFFVDEKYIEGFKCSERPSETLLNHIKKEPDYIEKLRNAFQITGLSEAMDIIKNV